MAKQQQQKKNTQMYFWDTILLQNASHWLEQDMNWSHELEKIIIQKTASVGYPQRLQHKQ